MGNSVLIRERGIARNARRPVVFNDATGAGAECCCGGTNPYCCFTGIVTGCGPNNRPFCCNFGSVWTYESQSEYHDVGSVDGAVTKNDWLFKEKTRYYVDLGPNGECRGYYAQCLEYVRYQVFTDASGQTHVQQNVTNCPSEIPYAVDSNQDAVDFPLLFEYANSQTGTDECDGDYTSDTGTGVDRVYRHMVWHYAFQPCTGWDFDFRLQTDELGGARTLDQHVFGWSRIYQEQGCSGDPCAGNGFAGGILPGSAPSAGSLLGALL